MKPSKELAGISGEFASPTSGELYPIKELSAPPPAAVSETSLEVQQPQPSQCSALDVNYESRRQEDVKGGTQNTIVGESHDAVEGGQKSEPGHDLEYLSAPNASTKEHSEADLAQDGLSSNLATGGEGEYGSGVAPLDVSVIMSHYNNEKVAHACRLTRTKQIRLWVI
jgi:hypothetical protein